MRLFEQVLNRAKPGPLPPSAEAKLGAMREQRDEAAAKSRGAGEKAREAGTLLSGLEIERVRLLTSDGSYRPDNLTVDKIEAAIAEQKAETRRRQEKADKAGAAASAVGAPVTVLETWLGDNKGAGFRPARVLPKLPARPRDGWGVALVSARQRIAELKADLHAVASAPIPAAEAKAKMRAEVAAIAEAGAPDVGGLLEGGSVGWPTTRLLNAAGQVVTYQALDARGLWAWFNRDELIARLEAEIDAIADPATALTSAQRQAEDARLRAALLAAEREEEAVIVAAKADGIVLLRRADADPRAVLELDDNVPGLEQ